MTDDSNTCGLGRRGFLKISGATLGGIALGSTVVAAESTERFVVRTSDAGSLDAEVVHDLSAIGYAVVRASESELERSNAVRDFVPDTTYELSPAANRIDTSESESATDEPGYRYQWDKEDQNVPDVHEITHGDGARVAIIDTGVAADHPDLQHAVNVGLSRNFTGDGFGSANAAGGYHGTHVGGIVAANDGNEVGVVGSAPAAELVDCRVFSPNAPASFGDVLAAMVYAANVGSDVANLSLGAYPVSRRAIGSFYGRALNRVTAYGAARGTVYVVAAGNDSADLQHDGRICVENDDGTVECFPAISLPNEAANVLSVSATGPIGFGWDATTVGDEEEPPYSPAFYTNYGTNAIDLAAPGGDASLAGIAEEEDGDDFNPPWYLDLVYNTVAIPTYEEDEEGTVTGVEGYEYTYSWAAGTSMAAPQVAGAVALVRSVAPDANANEVGTHLRNAASVPGGYDRAYYGAGYLDTLGAVESANQ